MSGRPRRPAPTILAKLLIAFVTPTLVLFGVFGLLAYDFARRDLDLARRDLETELGRRLASIAAATAAQIRGRYLTELAPGDEQARAYLNTKRKLDAVKAKTGVARLYVFRPDHTSLCDTAEGVPIGETYFQLDLDRHELGRVFREGAAVSSVLFRGKDGAWAKAGYAPVTASEDDDTIVAALGVEAPAEYFARIDEYHARLADLRRDIVRYGAALAAAVIGASIFVATRLTRPIRRLAADAERIGRGDLARPVAASGGDEIGRLARTLDEMREALRARDERLQMMLAGIAHEVRNPLGGIELYSGILRDDLAGDAEKLAHVARIERELGHLKAVVSDFLEYARRPKPELVPVELPPILAEAAECVRADAAAAGVALVVGPSDGEPPTVRADPTQLRRAVLNLLRNAVQATPAGGTVTLTARRAEGGRVELRVADTGRGIPAEARDKIFTPFYTTKEKGTGLGLAFVQEIVADHGGTIAIESAPGAGTTFTIALDEARS